MTSAKWKPNTNDDVLPTEFIVFYWLDLFQVAIGTFQYWIAGIIFTVDSNTKIPKYNSTLMNIILLIMNYGPTIV